MKGFIKKFIAISVVAVLTLCFAACEATPSSQESLSPGVTESQITNQQQQTGSGLNFQINVTNSLDIVPDGVAVLDVIRPSVVEIFAFLRDGTSGGSGVVLSTADANNDGVIDTAIIVTCHHVIEAATQIMVTAIDGRDYYASLVGSDPKSDIAVIMIESNEGNPFENITSATWYDRTSDLKVGTEVYAIGNPLGTLGGTVTSGIISAINRDVEVDGKLMTLIQTDAAINGGNSGGGLFDKYTGALLGIVNAGYASSTAEGLNFAIPGSTAIDIVEQIISNGYIDGRYDFGVEFALYRTSSWYNTTYYVGVDILDEYGMFAKNGLEEGDIILSIKIGDREEFVVPTISNSNINTIVDEVTAYLNDENCKIGDNVTINYRRYNQSGSYTDKTITFAVTQYVYGE